MASPIMKFFTFEHLPPELAEISVNFAVLAEWVDQHLPDGAEKSTALRRILEAKDCAVRAAL